ncbi:MAG: hypothetical protein AMXMBFR4_02790 [Candidatus Hydrogenedentota bacterium]
MVRKVVTSGCVAMAVVIASGCGTLGAVSNLANAIVGTTVKAADSTVKTVDKALQPSTYKSARGTTRSYHESISAPRTSARNFDAVNNVSSSVSEAKKGSPQSAKYTKNKKMKSSYKETQKKARKRQRQSNP